ncbi:LysM peptidoglycan-binding domain-containing protein [Ornithinimicrobium cavernae]|uniref:LysM peptidoglycan-binding domain-containing protein n=1 Tax=Ornithinimicrobium cavernae TaxID=2666047 RepID=UPI0012B16FC1|nr:LysM peptidoglycan-binding domain-containing protein [Ornithinimicrobium cavernae]
MNLRQRLVGLGALVVLVGILVGLPALLIALGGSPLPSGVPSLDQVRTALTTPDDGTLVLGAAKLLGWLVWAALAGSILVELVSQLRGMRAPRLPALALPQSTARGLVSAALAVFISAPVGAAMAAGGPVPADVAPVTMSVAVAAQAEASPAPHAGAPGTGPAVGLTADARAAGHAAVTSAPEHTAGPRTTETTDSTPAAETVTYTVQPGDTLWSIADAHLGSGRDFSAIVELNPEVLTDGADWVTPGMVLRLPAQGATGPVDEQGAYVVQEGDTLSDLALQHLDDGNRWPEIFEASKDRVQPDGRRLTDPDLIYPGWQLSIPGVTGGGAEKGDPAPADPGAAERAAEKGTATGTQVGTTAPVDLDNVTRIGAQAGTTGAELGAAHASGAEDDATPTPEELAAGVAGAIAPLAQSDAPAEETPEDDGPSWMLAGLAGSGALLSGGMLVVLAARRRGQFRNRRPGRSIAGPDPELAPVEKTVQTVGATAALTLQDLDETLRRLGGLSSRLGTPVPVLAAAQVGRRELTLHLSEPADLGAPWTGTADGLHWSLPADTPRDEVGPLAPDQPAPYPLLASIGAGDDGSRWLLNLEDLEVSISGDDDYARDLARYLAAEIAVNPWAAGVRLDCVGVAEEVTPMNPARLRAVGTEAVGDVLAEAVATIDRLGEDLDVPTARARQEGDDTWTARMMMISAEAAGAVPEYQQLSDLLVSHAGSTAAAVVVRGERRGAHTVQLVATDQGRVLMPQSGLDLIGVGLTDQEARGCAQLLAQGEALEDVPMPARPVDDVGEGWRTWVDEAGALRREHTLARHPEGGEEGLEETHSLLPDDEDSYLVSAATTAEDLDALAPRVSAEVARQVVDADPTLDEDLAAWWDEDSRLPRLRLLGAVGARTRGKPLVDRKPYFTELLAYLALRPEGATVEETAEAFGINAGKCRDYIGRCREWLGTNPRTGEPHLPHASKAPAAAVRGVNVYQVLDVLVDIDLFKRLRARAEARGGTDGIADLREALRLVRGRPFTQLRPGGWGWLFEGDRIDHHMVCAVVDVAHLVAVHDLRAGAFQSARLAAETAALAAPEEEIPTLDLAAVASAEGHHAEAVRLLRSDVCNRVDDEDSVPGELPERTQEILRRHRWLDQQREAG